MGNFIFKLLSFFLKENRSYCSICEVDFKAFLNDPIDFGYLKKLNKINFMDSISQVF